MAYNEEIANRIREALTGLPKVKEKKMFGSLAFMVDDKMCIAAGPDRIMCRVDPAMHEELLRTKACRSVIMRGQEYKGYVHVNGEDIKLKSDLDYWIRLALEYNKVAKASKKSE